MAHCQRGLCKAIFRRTQSSRRARRYGNRTQRQTGYRNRRGRGKHQLPGCSRGVGASLLSHRPRLWLQFLCEVSGNVRVGRPTIRAILRNADPALPITYFRTLDEQVNRSLNTERMLAALSSSFGTLALLLSLVGLYGVMSFVVTQRTREIGIRLALGATRLSAIWLVLRDALVMIAAGTAIALPCVWALGRLVESQLYDVKPTDPVTILAATLVLCSTALGAALIPARRASAVNPTDALRFE